VDRDREHTHGQGRARCGDLPELAPHLRRISQGIESIFSVRKELSTQERRPVRGSKASSGD
jgi:hypothetical protein